MQVIAPCNVSAEDLKSTVSRYGIWRRVNQNSNFKQHNMKTIKAGILSLGVAAMLLSCDTKEKAQLQHKVDSLNVELQASRKAEQTMNEVGVLLDSIDASRKSLQTKMVEGTSYADYISRLKDINTHIQTTQAKLEQMEKDVKSSNRSSAASIKRMKADLEQRQQEILALQMDIAKMREENTMLMANVHQKDSLLSSRDEMIKVKESDIAGLETLVTDINEQNKIKVANLYFAQAQALEEAASRTKFAARKKKETKREALELYKLSLSMGKTEAQERISELEKDLS